MSDASDGGGPDPTGGDGTDAEPTDGDGDEELEAIRQRKKEELLARAGGDEHADESTPASTTGSPTEPVHVEGEAHLHEVTAEHDVVLADFYADWCGPCQMMEPAIETVAAESAAVVAKVDVDAHQALAREYGVQGVPALFLFVDGEVVERRVGMQDQAALFDLVEAAA